MISIHCTQCKQLLEMDEAFAGGVCRCQFCGTIQTVPSRLKSSSKSNGSGGKSSPKPSSKALYKKGSSAGTTQTGTGLDELAEIVASSGLARGSLSKPPVKPRSATAETPEYVPLKRNPMLPWLIGAGGMVVVLLVTVAYLVSSRDSSMSRQSASGTPVPPTASDHTAVAPTPAPVPQIPAGPSFAGLALPGNDSVAYLIDCSQANEEILDAVKAAVYQSASSLGPNRQFQIIFWHRKDDTPPIVAFPKNGLAPATRDQVLDATKKLEDVVSYGNTDLKRTVEKAAESGARVFIIVTAKGYMLEEREARAVRAALKDASVKIHTLALGETESLGLKQIADQSGGQYRAMDYRQLRSLVQ